MLAKELPALLVFFAEKFPDLHLPDNFREAIDSLDPECDIPFEYFLRILRALLTGEHAVDDSDKRLPSEPTEIEFETSDSEGVYLQRMTELQEELRIQRLENEDLKSTISKLSRPNTLLVDPITSNFLPSREMLVKLVKNLLEATQALARDRSVLYSQLLKSLHGGSTISHQDIIKRTSLHACIIS